MEDVERLAGERLGPHGADDLVEVPSQQGADVLEHLPRTDAHLREPEVRIDEIHAERRALDEVVEGVAAPPDPLVGRVVRRSETGVRSLGVSAVTCRPV